jgi:hypothetical protein
MSTTKHFTNATGEPVADNTNIMTAGRRGPALLQDIWLIEKLAHFDREVIPDRRTFVLTECSHGGAAVGWAFRPIDENLPNSRRRRRRDLEPVKPREGGRTHPRLTVA